MYFPKINVKRDAVLRWHRPDRAFFANGACQILAYAFLERYTDMNFRARWIKPATGYTGNHTYVTDSVHSFDYHGLTTEKKLLALVQRRAARFFPGWRATLFDLPKEVLISEERSREIDGLRLMQPDQFLHNALPRAHAFLDRHGDVRARHALRNSAAPNLSA